MPSRSKYTSIGPEFKDEYRLTPDGRASVDVSTYTTESRDTIFLENVTIRRPQSRSGSTDTLLDHGPKSGQNIQVTQVFPSTDTKPRFFRSSMWLYDILSLAFAISILVAIVTVLVMYHGKPSPVVGGITLNTVVAFASTLFRISLMLPVTTSMCQLTWIWLKTGYRPVSDIARIDLASRGPLGSFRLLHEKPRGFLMFIAALTIILGVAIGPFFQQSVEFYSAKVRSPQSSDSVAYTSAAFTYSGSVGEPEILWGDGENVPFNLKSAMYTGLFSSGMVALPKPPFSCPSGNCTWDPFPTIGISIQCFDDTPGFHLNCSNPDLKPWPGYDFTPCTLEPIDPQQRGHWPASQYIVFASHRGYQSTAPFAARPPFNRSNFDYGFSEDPATIKSSLNEGFATFSWAMARNLLDGSHKDGLSTCITSSSTFEARTCFFYPSMQVIQAEVQNGLYSEHIVNTTTRIKPFQTTPNPPYSAPEVPSNAIQQLTYVFEPQCQMSGQPPPDACSPADKNTVDLVIHRQIYLNIVRAIGNSFPKGNLTTYLRSGLTSQKGSAAFEEGGKSLFRSPNITETMYTIAHYMSVALRANDTILAFQNDPQNKTGLPKDYVAPSHRVAGVVFVQAVHLSFRWWWLGYPATLLFITTVLLCGTIWSSRHEAVGVWKGSPLALLLNTEWRPEKEFMGAATAREMQDLAEGFEARVVQSDDGNSGMRRVVIRERGLAD